MPLLRLTVTTLLAAFPAGVTRADADSPVIAVPRIEVSDSATVLDRWLILGPFERADAIEALRGDLLPDPDGRLTAETFAKFAVAHGRGDAKTKAGSRMSEREPVVDLLKLYHIRPIDENQPVAFYAACELVTGVEREAYLQIGTDEAHRTWLNGSQIASFEGGRVVTLFDDGVRLRLQPGRNFLLIKVASRSNGAGFCLKYEPSMHAAGATALAAHGRFLDRIFCPDGTAPVLRIPGAPDGLQLDIAAGPVAGDHVASKRLANATGQVVAGKLAPGIYEAQAVFEQRAYRQRFLIGEPEAVWPAMQERARRFAANEKAAAHLFGLAERMRVLLLPSNRRPDNAGWQSKVVFALGEYESVLAALERGAEPFRHVPGMHVRAFHSRIDGANRYYRIAIPSDYRPDRPLPLLVVLPTPISANRPFLESPFMASHDEAVEVARAAERHGIAVLWPGYPCKPYVHPREFTYLDEVLAAVGEDYRVDPERISLSGHCGAAITAATASLIWPERFAAIVLKTPNFHKRANRLEDTIGFGLAGLPAYQKALDDADILEPFARTDVPVRIDHDGGDPGHGELGYSLEYLAAAARHGKYPGFFLDTRSVYPHTARDASMTWLSRQRRLLASSKQSGFLFKPGDPGPIKRALAEEFAVIVGTGGSARDQQAAAAIAQQFAEGWTRTNFVACRIVRDVDLDAVHLPPTNLVLVGNAATNRVWNRWIEAKVAATAAGEVVVRGKRFAGEQLGFQAVVPHPGHAGRSIVLIGGHDLPAAQFGTMELGVDGWYDFAVWRPSEPVPIAVDVGRF